MCGLCMSLSARSISTAGSFLILPASLYSRCSQHTCSCLKARQTQASIKSTLTHFSLGGVWLSFKKDLPPHAHTHTHMHTHTDAGTADLPEKANRARWQMCHGNNSPCHLFFRGFNAKSSPLRPVIKDRMKYKSHYGEVANNALSISPLGY